MRSVDRQSLLGTLAAVVLLFQTGVGHAHSIDDARVADWDPTLPANVEAARYPSPDGAVRQVIDQYKVWGTGATLTVCFFGGEPELRRFVANTAREWTAHGNLSLDFGDEPDLRTCDPDPKPGQASRIRIALDEGANWSLVGNDSMRADLTAPSMNLAAARGGYFALVDQEELRRVVLHEFGHAFGLQHEHQSPESGCEAKFDWPTVYQSLSGPPNNWDKDAVDQNLRPLLVSRRLRLADYDPRSIMHYSFEEWMFGGNQPNGCFVPPNTQLSEQDKIVFAKTYPKTAEEQRTYVAGLERGTSDVLRQRGVSADLAKEVTAAIQTITVCGFAGGVAFGGDLEDADIATRAEGDRQGACPEGTTVTGAQGGVAIGGNAKRVKIRTGGAQ